MAKKKGGAGSDQALIVALVFFVLSTLGLAVGTYYGFAGQAALESAKNEQTKSAKVMEESRDYFRAQAVAYRAMMGLGTVDPSEAGTRKGQLDEDKIGKSEKDKDEVKNILSEVTAPKDLNRPKAPVWPKGKNVPDVTFVKIVNDERTRADTLADTNRTLTATKDNLDRQLKDSRDALQEAKETFAKELADSKKKAENDLSVYVKTIADLRNDVNKLNVEKDGLVKRLDDEQTGGRKQRDAMDKRLAEQRDLIHSRDNQINAEKKRGELEMPKDWRADWRIVNIDRFGKNVYINLGASDRLQPQITFSIHGTDASGRPVTESKGSLEIVRVLSDHLSQARITSLKDANRDPVLINDFLYNPSWNPSVQKHVAVAGIIDMTGDGRDSLQDFLRILERENVVIDAYLDPRDFTIKNKGITVKTDFLIVGIQPEGSSGWEDKHVKETAERFSRGIGEMTDQALRYGVQIIGSGRYLEQMGYAVPRPKANRQQLGTEYRGRVNTISDSKQDTSAPPNDDKPAPEKPEKKENKVPAQQPK